MADRALNQLRTFEALWAELRPAICTDRNLAARIQQRLSRARRFGSRDRRLYRELLYTGIRFLPWIEEIGERSKDEAHRALLWLASDAPATREMKQSFLAGWPAAPSTIDGKANFLAVHRPLFPDWFIRECPAANVAPNLDVLHTRAPLWLRIHSSDTRTVTTEFSELGWEWKVSPVLPTAWRLLTETDAASTESFRRGLFEVQDLGSQLILASIGIEAGEKWLDACAGAGGKTLQLASLLGPMGRVAAYDIRPAALAELVARAARAGLGNVEIVEKPTDEFDGVLVDAPCSGSGTWRRSPHLKWTTSENDLQAMADVQTSLLDRFSAYVRPGGRLVYATCSLCPCENEHVAEFFLSTHSDFRFGGFARTLGFTPSEPGLTVWPASHDTDGFYVASFRRI